MREDELYKILVENFRDREFSMSDILTVIYGENKPRSNTSEYRRIMHSLLAIEKKGRIVSRKIQNIKYYTFPETARRMEEERRKAREEQFKIDYELVREMVIEGLRTGRIYCLGYNPQERYLLSYIRDNIEMLIKRVQPPYEKIEIIKNPMYLEIRPVS